MLLQYQNKPNTRYRYSKDHFESCGSIPSEERVEIFGKNKGEKLLSLEALFINKLKPSLNSKDEYSSHVLLSFSLLFS